MLWDHTKEEVEDWLTFQLKQDRIVFVYIDLA